MEKSPRSVRAAVLTCPILITKTRLNLSIGCERFLFAILTLSYFYHMPRRHWFFLPFLILPIISSIFLTTSVLAIDDSGHYDQTECSSLGFDWCTPNTGSQYCSGNFDSPNKECPLYNQTDCEAKGRNWCNDGTTTWCAYTGDTCPTNPITTGAACVVVDSTSSIVPTIDGPDTGTGYAKQAQNVSGGAAIQTACTTDIFTSLLQTYCQTNTAPANRMVLYFNDSGSPALDCSIRGCAPISCATVPPPPPPPPPPPSASEDIILPTEETTSTSSTPSTSSTTLLMATSTLLTVSSTLKISSSTTSTVLLATSTEALAKKERSALPKVIDVRAGAKALKQLRSSTLIISRTLNNLDTIVQKMEKNGLWVDTKLIKTFVDVRSNSNQIQKAKAYNDIVDVSRQLLAHTQTINTILPTMQKLSRLAETMKLLMSRLALEEKNLALALNREARLGHNVQAERQALQPLLDEIRAGLSSLKRGTVSLADIPDFVDIHIVTPLNQLDQKIAELRGLRFNSAAAARFQKQIQNTLTTGGTNVKKIDTDAIGHSML